MEKLHEILNYSVGNFTVGKILAAVVVFVVCYLVIRLVLHILGRILERTHLDATLAKILKIAIKMVLYFVAAMIVIDTLGISVTSLLAAFSVVGLAASLAVQDSLSNLASGIMLLVTKPFKIGDYVEADGVDGTVTRLGLIHTHIATIDNKMIFVPNSKVISGEITNYTAQEKRRVDLDVSVSYNASITEVRNSILESIQTVGLFLDTPDAPFVAVQSYDESSISYVVRAWANTADYWPAHFGLLEQIKADFDKNGIEMTYNHLNVHMIADTKEGESK